MNTSHTVRKLAAAAAIAGTFFAATACGSEESATGTITRPAQAPSVDDSAPAHRAYPADGRENRHGQKSYPADGRENRNPVTGGFGWEHRQPADW